MRNILIADCWLEWPKTTTSFELLTLLFNSFFGFCCLNDALHSHYNRHHLLVDVITDVNSLLFLLSGDFFLKKNKQIESNHALKEIRSAFCFNFLLLFLINRRLSKVSIVWPLWLFLLYVVLYTILYYFAIN